MKRGAGCVMSDLTSKRSERLLREVRAPYLVGDKREALARFLARLEAECADDIRRVILFGSHARGNAEAESDIDLLIVTRGGIENARRINKWCIGNEGSWVSALVFTEAEYQDDQRFKPPLYVNVRRDGIELWDPDAQMNEEHAVPLDFREGEFRILDYETIETIRSYLREMRESVDVARDLEKLAHPGKAVAELYYAAFCVTTAALYTINVVRTKHKGVRDAVSEFLVKPKLVEAEYADIYERLMDGRLNVDYRAQKKLKGEKILTDDELKRLLRDGERYIERMKQFLIERGVDKSDFA